MVNGVMLILVAAGTYTGLGFTDGTLPNQCVSAGDDACQPVMEDDFWTAVYFSTVTFTTLGYGDYRPSPDARPVAALQAVLGYIYLGLLVATAGKLRRPKPDDRGTPDGDAEYR